MKQNEEVVFEEFEMKLNDALDQLDGYCFVKSNWNSAKVFPEC